MKLQQKSDLKYKVKTKMRSGSEGYGNIFHDERMQPRKYNRYAKKENTPNELFHF